MSTELISLLQYLSESPWLDFFVVVELNSLAVWSHQLPMSLGESGLA